MSIITDMLEKLGLVAKDAPIDPDDVGVNEIGAEEKVVDDWKVIAEKLYPAAIGTNSLTSTSLGATGPYSGPAFVESIKFKGIALIDLKPEWLLNTVIWGECKKADATPLKATLRERRIKTPYFPDIFSEYELIFHYHDSPLIMVVGGLIVATLIAAGFLILATKAPRAEDWKAFSESVKKTSGNILSVVKWAVVGAGGFYLVKKFK